jgi:hypothetical protein
MAWSNSCPIARGCNIRKLAIADRAVLSRGGERSLKQRGPKPMRQVTSKAAKLEIQFAYFRR